MQTLPPHLKRMLSQHEEKLEAFGITPMHKILEDQKKNMEDNPDHILHAFVGG